jgi:hypothetical protein
MKYLLSFTFFLLGLLLANSSFGQNIPDLMPKTPQVSTFEIINPNLSPTRTTTNSQSSARFYNPNPNNQKQLAQYERDRLRVEQEKNARRQLYKDLNENRPILYELPYARNSLNSRHFYAAFDSLQKMNANNYSIKEATFLIENAFYDNNKSFDEFDKTVKSTTEFIKQVMVQQKLDPSNDIDKNQTLFAFMTDTLSVNGNTHYPFKYDFNDYMGQENWENMFVHKLMREGAGQCNSLPRYYLILAEELETESYLALAPRHSYIRFKNNNGEWFNAELTSGAIMTDNFMVESGYIKSEAVLNRSYLTEQTKKQVMSLLLNDLASGYISKFGYDGFVGKVINHSLELNPDGINGNLHKIQYMIAEFKFVAMQLGVQSQEVMNRYPKLVAMHQAIQTQDQKLRNLGFEVMPQEKYEAWLSDMKKEKERQEKEYLKDNFRIDLNQIKN